MFIDRSFLLETASGVVDKIAKSAIEKLIPRNLDLFCIMAVNSHSLAVNGVHTNISNDRVTEALRMAI